jgi:thiamine-monophosphate kinase
MGSPKSRVTPRGRSGTAGGNSGEFAAIERLRRRLPGPPAAEVWIGDDAAVLAQTRGRIILTTDVSVAGVHADLELMGLDDLGWRAFTAAVSDVAAMGGRPLGAVVAVAGPAETDLDLLYGGIAGSSEAHGCPVVGGDLSNADQVVVAIAVSGHVDGDPGPVLRSGARPGHHLFVTGPLGASAAGLRSLRSRADARAPTGGRPDGAGARADAPGADIASDEGVRVEMAHRRPRARLDEGETARRAGATAMIDVSDGLLADLGHVADASGVGFALDRVPVSPGATIEDALRGGEDYELVLATPDPEALVTAFSTAGLRPPVLLGSCRRDPVERTLAGQPVTSGGWEHPWE